MRMRYEDSILRAPEDGGGASGGDDGNKEPDKGPDKEPDKGPDKEPDKKPADDPFNKLSGDDGKDKDPDPDKGGEDKVHEKPDWISPEFWDSKTGEVDVEKMQASEKEAKEALRGKNNVPEVTEENPIGYDTKFLTEAHGEEGDEDYHAAYFTEEHMKSEEFQAYALSANKEGISQSGFEFQIESFFKWKTDYDYAYGLDLDPDQIIEDYKEAAIKQYGAEPAEKNWEFMTRWSANPANVHPNILRGLKMSAEGIQLLTTMAMDTLDSKGVTNKDSVDTGPHDLAAIDTKLTDLRLERDALPSGDKKNQLEKAIDNLTKEKVAMQGPRRKHAGLSETVPSKSMTWAGQMADKHKFQKKVIKT